MRSTTFGTPRSPNAVRAVPSMVSSTTEAWCSRLWSGESSANFRVVDSKRSSSSSTSSIYGQQHATSQHHHSLTNEAGCCLTSPLLPSMCAERRAVGSSSTTLLSCAISWVVSWVDREQVLPSSAVDALPAIQSHVRGTHGEFSSTCLLHAGVAL